MNQLESKLASVKIRAEIDPQLRVLLEIISVMKAGMIEAIKTTNETSHHNVVLRTALTTANNLSEKL